MEDLGSSEGCPHVDRLRLFVFEPRVGGKLPGLELIPCEEIKPPDIGGGNAFLQLVTLRLGVPEKQRGRQEKRKYNDQAQTKRFGGHHWLKSRCVFVSTSTDGRQRSEDLQRPTECNKQAKRLLSRKTLRLMSRAEPRILLR